MPPLTTGYRFRVNNLTLTVPPPPPPPPNFACSIVFNLSRDNSNTQWKLDTRVKFSRGRGIVGDAKVAHGYFKLGWHFISLIKLFFYNLNPFYIKYFFTLEKSVSLF